MKFTPTWWTLIDWTVVLYGLVAITVAAFVLVPIMILVVRQWDVGFLMRRAVRKCAKKGR